MTFEEWFKLNRDMLKSAYDAGFQEGSKQPTPLTVTTVPTPPYVKYPPAANPRPDDPFKRTHETTWPNIKSCSKCGINLEGIMGYVCYDMKCPTQMRITAGGKSTVSGITYSIGSTGSIGANGSISSSDRYSDTCGYTNCSG
jgi:hypothetical protein